MLEVIRDLVRDGALRRDPTGVWHPTSTSAVDRAREVALTGKQRAIWARAEREPRDSRELLRLLSLLGRPAPAALLAATTGRTVDATLSLLEPLGMSELVRHDAGLLDLPRPRRGDHPRPSRRRRAGPPHQLLARALGEDGAPADEIARHLAGAGDAPAASTAYARAAQDRLDHHADREAEQLADEGLALEPAGAPRASLLETRAQTRARRGDLVGAGEDLRAALALADASSTRSRLFARLAALRSGSEDLLRAAHLAGLAITEAGDDWPHGRARCTSRRSST